mgnify:CR=1 FL=1
MKKKFSSGSYKNVKCFKPVKANLSINDILLPARDLFGKEENSFI